jgi:hypothetical protein
MMCAQNMSRIEETLGGLWCLVMLAMRGALGRRSHYWKWRDETAFGHPPAQRPSLPKRLRAMLDYGRWVYRMKRRL